ncbi:hypothetical protein HOK51_08550 [Candidatus Woesearchaeota archaeon]|jgi:aldehyde:ferredoxin oxidoreductase|nr:hypothetical protein [Candidatus Woesearchaeota archaeon]MBT6519876.1 hypothetical protein [Candidatus Woesearchaeota archaeon]MBT7367168.1 hypothetical protein [Candidatus Woesearchaeota archaeon]
MTNENKPKKLIKKLNINLTNGATSINAKDAADCSLEETLGGYGNAIHEIRNHLDRNPDLTDAYDPRNLLCFDIGCFTGSKLMTSKRTIVSGLSPLKTSEVGTNGIFYSASSGGLGGEIRKCDLDSIHLIGKCETPSYLVIENGNVSIEDATDLVGMTTDEKVKYLAGKHEKSAYAVIGPAGENLVRFASIAFSTYDQLKHGTKHMRFAGRGGMGAVLGSKNILGVVVKGGDGKANIGNVVELNKEIARGNRTKKYRQLGTFQANILSMEPKRVNIHENFQRGSDPETQKLLRANLEEAGYSIKDKGCQGCGVKCWKEIQKGDRILGKLDFEPGQLLGPNLEINDIEQMMQLIELADGLGMDSMSAGVGIGYLMEQENRFGDFEFAKEILMKIADGVHDLKEGVARYSNNASNAMHVKGVEMAAYPGQLNIGYAFAATGPHMSIDTYNRAWYPGAENTVEEWVENIARGAKMILYDMNGICKFAKVNFDEITELYNRLYDSDVSSDEIKNIGVKAALMTRQMDFGLGFTEDDDCLPGRCFEDMGSTVEHFNTPKFFAAVKEGVYEKFKELEGELL